MIFIQDLPSPVRGERVNDQDALVRIVCFQQAIHARTDGIRAVKNGNYDRDSFPDSRGRMDISNRFVLRESRLLRGAFCVRLDYWQGAHSGSCRLGLHKRQA